jgi:hypothetical protein
MNSTAMPGRTRGLTFSVLTLAVLLVVAGALVGGAAAARHHHDGLGLYDDRCPLEALATLDRTASGIVAVATATPVEVATALVVPLLVARLGLPAAADARLRAPPVR